VLGIAHMSPVAPLLRIPVGVVVERRKATSQWVDVVWRPVAVLGGLPDAAPWTPLAGDGETETFYAGGAEIELYRSRPCENAPAANHSAISCHCKGCGGANIPDTPPSRAIKLPATITVKRFHTASLGS